MTPNRPEPLDVAVEVLPRAAGLPMPAYATAGASGLDLLAAVEAPVTVAPSGRALVPTGLRIAVPEGFEAQVRPRSGLAWKHGIVVPNAPGTIDADYRGELSVILLNLSDEPFVVERGMRVAQLVFAPVVRATLRAVAALPPTPRGEGGFGHTGLR